MYKSQFHKIDTYDLFCAPGTQLKKLKYHQISLVLF